MAALSVEHSGSVDDGREGDLVDASRERLQSFQDFIEDMGRDLKKLSSSSRDRNNPTYDFVDDPF